MAVSLICRNCPSSAATSRHQISGGEDKILARVERLRSWTEELAAELRTYPTRPYFFLADFAPHDAGELAGHLRERGIFVKPLGDPRLGPGFMRVTTALPADNSRVVQALRKLL
ncbi:MAG: hypothetical protein IH613_06595 [Desulfuromonadales bacterium]|nr:hypothetical protein [Desulfuromonadales bacterium]